MPPRMLFADTLLLDRPAATRATPSTRVSRRSASGLGTARLVTTDEVLTEVLNWFSGSGPYWRGKAAALGPRPAERPRRGRAAADPRRLRRRSRPVRGPARQGVQPDRLPVDGRPASAGHHRGIDQRSSFHPRRIHDLVSVAPDPNRRPVEYAPVRHKRQGPTPTRERKRNRGAPADVVVGASRDAMTCWPLLPVAGEPRVPSILHRPSSVSPAKNESVAAVDAWLSSSVKVPSSRPTAPRSERPRVLIDLQRAAVHDPVLAWLTAVGRSLRACPPSWSGLCNCHRKDVFVFTDKSPPSKSAL